MSEGHISEPAQPEDAPQAPEDTEYPPDPVEENWDEGIPPLRGAAARKAALQRHRPVVAKSGGIKKNAARRLLAAEKRGKALELRKAGATYEAIAKNVGYADAGGAYKAVQRAFRDVVQEPVQELRTIQVERLNHMLMTLWSKVQLGDERAINTSLSIMDKIDRLMGTDQAAQVEVNVQQTSAVLVVDGNKDDYIRALQRMSGAGVQPDGTNARAIEAGARGPMYPPGMGGGTHQHAVDKSVDDVVDGEVVEDEHPPQQDDESLRHPTEGAQMSDCTSPLGTVCKDPACPLHNPEQPRRKFNFGVDPTIRRSTSD